MKKFKLKKGQIDFSKTRFAPVINCVLKYKDKILLVRRSRELNFYPGYWNGISGFLDDNQTLEQKVANEIKEETGIAKKNIIFIKSGNIFLQDEPKYKKTWIVIPILVKVKNDKIKTDWEAEDYKWIKLSEINKSRLLPGFNKVLNSLKKFK